jgi:hypothetical protein
MPKNLRSFLLTVQGDLQGGVRTLADEKKRFVEEFANPHSWLMMADNLHEQATEIYERRSRSTIITKVNANREIVQQTRGIDKLVFLLGGFALENAIKAFLVYENPGWVSNGRLSGNLRSHSLTGLHKSFGPRDAIKRLPSWGKPPVPAATIAKVLALTSSRPPPETTHWAGRAMAKAVGHRRQLRCS